MDGALSNALARLRARGNQIVNAATGEPVLLRGVNRSGLEYSDPDHDSFISAAGMSGHEFRWIVWNWKANLFRIPFNQQWALRGCGDKSSEDYLRDLDRAIGWASRYGAYTLLDLQCLDLQRSFGGGRQFVAPLPNLDTPRLWAMLAERYASEPAVMFDILNEPHDRLDDDPYPLLHPDGTEYPKEFRRVSMTEWRPWAELLVDTIRTRAPETPIVVSGTNWGYDLRGFPLDRENLIYSTHVYPNKGINWDVAFGNLTRFIPVIAAEFGGWDDDLEWGRSLLDYFDRHKMGWAAWSWSDKPHLIDRYAASPFGEIVRSRLQNS
jgi:aryl-phospho-beta-D-glucosidase BglC (GH1 family)